MVRRTFDKWSSEVERLLNSEIHTRPVHVRFVEASNANDADIVIKWETGEVVGEIMPFQNVYSGKHGDGHDFDGPGKSNKRNVIAHAFPPMGQPSASADDGDIHMDDDERWTLSPAHDTMALASVLMHEIGHALGLAHSNHAGAVMNPTYKNVTLDNIRLHIDDMCSLSTAYRGATDACLRVGVLNALSNY